MVQQAINAFSPAACFTFTPLDRSYPGFKKRIYLRCITVTFIIFGRAREE